MRVSRSSTKEKNFFSKENLWELAGETVSTVHPFLSLHKPLRFPIQCATTGHRVLTSNITLLKKARKRSYSAIFKAAVGVILAIIDVARLIFKHPMLQAISTLWNIGNTLREFKTAVDKRDLWRIFKSCLLVASQALALTILLKTTPIFLLVAFFIRMVLSAIRVGTEFTKRRWIAGSGQAIMMVIQGKQEIEKKRD